MNLPAAVRIVEVGPRDGIQNESRPVSTNAKIALVEGLAEAGLRTIEVGSFVSPKWVPQMEDTATVLSQITRQAGVSYTVLVPNMKGLEAAMAAGACELAVFAAASETFSRKNINCSIAESLSRLREVVSAAASADLKVRGYVSCVLGCPYEGVIDPERVLSVASELIDLGSYEVSLGDTIGIGTPRKTETLIQAVMPRIGAARIAMHFHDTWGQALANILVALQMGIAVFDSSVAGLGGCPYAPGAAGNVATEDLLYMLQGMGVETGISLERVAEAGRLICGELGKKPASKVATALLSRSV